MKVKAFNLSSLPQKLPWQNNEFPFLDDSQSTNCTGELDEINSFNQFVALGNNYSNDDDSIDVYHD